MSRLGPLESKDLLEFTLHPQDVTQRLAAVRPSANVSCIEDLKFFNFFKTIKSGWTLGTPASHPLCTFVSLTPKVDLRGVLQSCMVPGTWRAFNKCLPEEFGKGWESQKGKACQTNFSLMTAGHLVAPPGSKWWRVAGVDRCSLTWETEKLCLLCLPMAWTGFGLGC